MLTLPVNKGDIIAWQFRTKENDIGFDVQFEEKATKKVGWYRSVAMSYVLCCGLWPLKTMAMWYGDRVWLRATSGCGLCMGYGVMCYAWALDGTYIVCNSPLIPVLYLAKAYV